MSHTTSTDTTQLDFGVAMRRARKEKGLSQRDLAALVEINTETINRVERGLNTRTDTLQKIRQHLPNMIGNFLPIPSGAAALERERLKLEMEQEKHRIQDLQERVMHLVQAITSIERLQHLQTIALKALNAELDKTKKTSRRSKR